MIPVRVACTSHCILVRVACFPADAPLFDPEACFRREFFDLFWSIRRRGGEVALAATSIVIYDRLAWRPRVPTAAAEPGAGDKENAAPSVDCCGAGYALEPLDDFVNFAARRHDEISADSVAHLGRKWRVTYAADGWHEALRDETLSGLHIRAGNTPECCKDASISARLTLALLVAAGFNRFERRAAKDGDGDGNEAGSRSVMNALGALRELPDAAAGQNDVHVRLRHERAGESAFSIDNYGDEEATDPLDGVVPLAVATATELKSSGMADLVAPAQSVPLLACLSALPRLSADRCSRWACLLAGSNAWLWLRLPGVDLPAEESRARTLVQQLAHALGGANGELVSTIELTRRFSWWCYRPLSLDALDEICRAERQTATALQPETRTECATIKPLAIPATAASQGTRRVQRALVARLRRAARTVIIS